MKSIHFLMIFPLILSLMAGCSSSPDKYNIQSLSILPSDTTQILSAGTRQFTCKALYGDSIERDFSPQWSVSTSGIGTINQSGLFTAATVHVTVEGQIIATTSSIIASSDIKIQPEAQLSAPSQESSIILNPTQEAQPPAVIIKDFPLKFSILGNKIIDDKGNEFVFRGVNILDPGWMDAVYYNLNDGYFAELETWKVKIIRIPVHPASYKYYGEKIYLSLLDKVLSLAEKHKIYAIIDFHSIGFPPESTYNDLQSANTPWKGSIYVYTDQELKDFWKAMADHYKDDNRVVFYELFNETTSDGVGDQSSWNKWKTKAEELIDHIRTYDLDAKIIVGGINYSYDVSFAEANPVNKINIVYGTHPYPNQVKNSDDAFGKLKAKYPVFATEFGFDQSATGKHYQADSSYGDQMISYLETKKISWTVWHFSPDWLPALISDWNYNTTTSGDFFKTALKTLN